MVTREESPCLLSRITGRSSPPFIKLCIHYHFYGDNKSSSRATIIGVLLTVLSFNCKLLVYHTLLACFLSSLNNIINMQAQFVPLGQCWGVPLDLVPEYIRNRIRFQFNSIQSVAAKLVVVQAYRLGCSVLSTGRAHIRWGCESGSWISVGCRHPASCEIK